MIRRRQCPFVDWELCLGVIGPGVRRRRRVGGLGDGVSPREERGGGGVGRCATGGREMCVGDGAHLLRSPNYAALRAYVRQREPTSFLSSVLCFLELPSTYLLCTKMPGGAH